MVFTLQHMRLYMVLYGININKKCIKFMKNNTFFITGTDTDVGKTIITKGLITLFKQKNKTAVGIKPISAGLDKFKGKMLNADVAELMQVNSVKIDSEILNPYAFKYPASPHISSMNENISIDFNFIKKKVNEINKEVDYLFIEGAGGYFCPLDSSRTLSDLIYYIGEPVIVVVGLKLGCLNHALMTIKALEQKQQNIFGWIANTIEPKMNFEKENINYLKENIKHPFLGHVPYIENNAEKNFSNYISWPLSPAT